MNNCLPGIEVRPTSEKMSRERTYDLKGMRSDKIDLSGQLAITVLQLVEEGFIGQIIINCGPGGITNVTAKEFQRIL